MAIHYRERAASDLSDSEKDMYLFKFLDQRAGVIREYLVFRFQIGEFFEKVFDHREVLKSFERVDWERVEDLQNDMTKIENLEKFSEERGLGPIEKNLKEKVLYDDGDYTVEKLNDFLLVLYGESCHKFVDMREEKLAEVLVDMQKDIDSEERDLASVENFTKHIENFHNKTHNDKGERIKSFEEIKNMDFSLDEDDIE